MLSPPREKFVSALQEFNTQQVDQKPEPPVQDLDISRQHRLNAKERSIGPATSVESLLVDHQTSSDLANSPFAMADGRASHRNSSNLSHGEAEVEGLANFDIAVNEARAMRVMELMNDFRTLQIHVTSLITRSEANPPDQQSYYLDGYVVLRQCAAESQAVLAGHFNPGSIGLQAGNIPETEVQKASLQR